jgi:RND family efflux transporter MFP subunit
MNRRTILVALIAALVGAGAYASVTQIRSRWSKPAAAPAMSAQEHEGHPVPPQAPERKILYWYDPMHPQYRSDKPGIAPDCGVELVPKYADQDNRSTPAEMPSGALRITPERQQLIGVRTGTVRPERLERTIRTTGQVAFDETRIAHVHTKVNGYIEDVFVDFVGKFVRRGDPLFTIYSPDLVATQEEYLIARRGQKSLSDASYPELSHNADSLVRAALERLRLWDVNDADIRALESTGQAKRTLTIYSPATGVVTERAAYHHGRYVTPDTDLYTIVDLSNVWVLADVFENEVPYVRLGQRAQMQLSYLGNRSYTGRVSFIYPTLDPKTRTVKVRLEFPNPGFALKPEMYADVELKVDYGTHLVVPREAVLDSGTEQIVFIAHPEGFFEPRKVQVGPTADGRTVILSGLRPGETIVTSGNFLIDSESRLKSALGEMQH